MRVWLMLTAMAVALVVAAAVVAAAVIVAWGGDGGEEAPQAPIEAPIETPAAILCQQAQGRVGGLKLEVSLWTSAIARYCKSKTEPGCGYREGQLTIAQLELEQALHDVSKYCH